MFSLVMYISYISCYKLYSYIPLLDFCWAMAHGHRLFLSHLTTSCTWHAMARLARAVLVAPAFVAFVGQLPLSPPRSVARDAMAKMAKIEVSVFSDLA